MSKPEWGTKRMCPSCGTKYYDLRRHPIVCPRCGTEFDPDAVLRSRRTRPAPKEAAVVPVSPAKAVETEAEDEEALGDEVGEFDEALAGEDEAEDESLIEDASELGDDDMAEVVIDDDSDSREA